MQTYMNTPDKSINKSNSNKTCRIIDTVRRLLNGANRFYLMKEVKVSNLNW